MSRIFITGASGYIGGDVLYGLTKSNLASRIVALVRSEATAARIVNKHPTVTPLIGDLDAASSIQDAVAEADVVLHLASSSHVESAKAIAQGVSKTQRERPVWIQISGASLLSGPEIASNSFGNVSSRKYNDLQNKDELHEIIASSPKRVVDRLVTGHHHEQPAVRTAMIYGPMIYGEGRGPVKQRSIQIPDLAKATLQRGHGVHVGKGLSVWSHVHVSDITQLVLKLVAASQNTQDKSPLWNEDGIYFADAGNLPFKDIAQKMADFAYSKGFITSNTVEEVDPSVADGITAHATVLLGTNAQTRGDRARKELGWEPQGTTLAEEIERSILVEQDALNNAESKI